MTAAGTAPSVTSVLVRLKLSLLRNGLRQSGGRRAAYVTSLVVVLLFAALQTLGLVALRGHAHVESVIVLLVAVLALGWAVMPLFFPSGDETLDATRLVMLPLRPGPLVRALLAASLVGIGPLFTLCLLLGSVVALAHGAAAAVTGVLGVALALLVCVALARAVAAANVRLLSSRRGRDLAVLSGLVIAVGAQVVNFGAQRLGVSGLAQLTPVGDVLRWVPPGSAIAAVDAVSRGAYGTAAAQLALSCAALAGLLALWARHLTRLMTSPDGSTLNAAGPPDRERAAGGRGAGGLAGLLPAGRTGTVMERSLRYVWRDPKTKAAWATSLAIGLIVPVFNAVQGTGTIYFACFAAGMLGVQMYNQFGQDTSAFWMVAATISDGRDAYVELRGRALALLVITLPYAVVVTVLTTALLGAWTRLPEVLGLSLALLGAMLATGAWTSARFPYSIPQEGYKNVAPGQAGLAWISIFGGMVAAALLCSPVIAVTIWLNVSAGGDRHLWLLLPLGAAYGAGVGWAGLRLAAPRTANRLPEILTAVSKG
ncbi:MULTISPECIES: transporter [Streptomyces]|uniref:Transporter n=1 Tax=Streptomyces doudnae TaxID=3075536 RepID=A0ABD5EVR5_9ACTN|nr:MULTISPECIES: transporter [unclassified Streptomyces]MDT0438104.1 transporter [Streptomyces sp. DSM 41981]MYQ65071.1 transporter [Streptomyces sp. SID4950]SCD91893.1 ABC-2 type transport system permease protein [Streptomyces sp. SolWspMP-5a-2]